MGEELTKLGVGAAPSAVRAAKERGLSPSDASRLIAEFRAAPGAWRPGALYERLTGKLTAWPPPDKQHQRAQRRQETNDRAAEQHEKNEAAKRVAEAERKELADQETQYGPKLDAMGRNEVKALLERVLPDPNVRKTYPKKMLRTELLKALAERNGVPA